MQRDYSLNVSPDTIRRTLKAAGLGSLEREKRPHISHANAKKRLSWCHAHRDWTSSDWKLVIFTDETKINRFNSDGRQWAWIRNNEPLKPKHVKPTVKHGGGCIMLWSAITSAGVGWMCKIDGNMDKGLYQNILEDELDQSVDYMCEVLDLKRHQVWF